MTFGTINSPGEVGDHALETGGDDRRFPQLQTQSKVPCQYAPDGLKGDVFNGYFHGVCSAGYVIENEGGFLRVYPPTDDLIVRLKDWQA